MNSLGAMMRWSAATKSGQGQSGDGGEFIAVDNDTDLDTITPTECYPCDKVRFFNNRKSPGALIQGVDVTNTPNNVESSELTTDLEDAAVLAL